jgi:hypothetical protein
MLKTQQLTKRYEEFREEDMERLYPEYMGQEYLNYLSKD